MLVLVYVLGCNQLPYIILICIFHKFSCDKLSETYVPPIGVFSIQIPPRGRTQSDTKVQCYEPATMKYLGFFPALTPDEVSDDVYGYALL